MIQNILAFKHFFYYLEKKLTKEALQDVRLAIFYEKTYQSLAENLAQSTYRPDSFHIDIFSLESFTSEAIIKILDNATLGIFFYNVHTGDVPSPAGNPYIIPLKTYFEKNWKRCLPFIDVNQHFEEIYAHSPMDLASINEHFIGKAKKANWIKITNSQGTDLKIQLNDQIKWTNIDGVNSIDIVPSEVATHTYDINGYVRFTGTFLSAIPFARKYGIIEEQLEFCLESGNISQIQCTNSALLKDFTYYVNRSVSNSRVEEIGFGTNMGIKRLYGYNTAFEERHPGFHLGLGGREVSSHHLDLIFSDSTIFFEDECVFSNGNFIGFSG